MELVPRTSENLRDLVNQLDERLPVRESEPAAVPVERPSLGRVPAWLGFAMVTLLGIGIGAAVVQPWHDRCAYNREEVCAIAQLDIDALRITIPESRLIASLPNIESIDPNDELTTGEIFAMDRFAHLNVEELLSDDEIDRVLGTAG